MDADGPTVPTASPSTLVLPVVLKPFAEEREQAERPAFGQAVFAEGVVDIFVGDWRDSSSKLFRGGNWLAC